MVSTTLFFLLLCIPSLGLAQGPTPHPFWRRASRNVPPEGYYDPNANGGRMLTKVPQTFPAGLGEPVNIIIAGTSDEDVLKDVETNGGLRNYYFSLGFSAECLGQHAGSDQAADLGDGNGYKNETAVIRWNYGDAQLGACKETIQGGNHFRYWVQSGDKGNSGAIFMAMSYEKPIAEQHDIVVNGYNLARDYVVGNISQQTIPTTTGLSNTSTYSGQTSYAGYTYQTDIKYVSGLLQNSSDGINHFASVGQGLPSAIDGLVAVFNVKITGKPNQKSAAWKTASPLFWEKLTFLWVIAALPFIPLAASL